MNLFRVWLYYTQGVGTAEKDIWWNKIGENLPIFNCGLSPSGPWKFILY